MSSLKKIRQFYEKLKIEDVEDLADIYEEDAFFKDPFNELKGLTNIRKIFDEMFHELKNPRFVFIDEINSSDQAFLSWDFLFEKAGRKYKIHGSTHLKLSANGKINYHRDYWDVGEELLLKIPILKNLYSVLRNKLSVN